MNYGLVLDQMLNPNITKKAFASFLTENKIDTKVLLEKSIAPVIYYDQRPLATGTAAAPAIVQFFGPRTGTPDNTNMKNSNYTLPDSEHVVVAAVRMLYAATGTTLSANDWDWGATSIIAKNLLIEMKANNITVLSLLAGTGFNPELTTDDEGFIRVPNLFLWKGQTAITVNVTCQSTAATNAALRIEVHGIGLVS